MDLTCEFSGQLGRRQMLAMGAVAAFGAASAMVLADARPAAAAVSPKLPGEIGRVNNQVSRYAGTKFDHIRLSIGGDGARMFVPQGILPGSQKVPVLWLYHAAGSSEDALTGGFRNMGERGVDLGMVVICQNLGGTMYTSPTARQHQLNGWAYLSGLYGIDRNFLRATSHGGAMASEVLLTGMLPNVVGAYILNGVYDVANLRANGSASQKAAINSAFAGDTAQIAAANPARHVGAAWNGKRVRVTYSQPDGSDPTVPPQFHAKQLVINASPAAAEATVRTHTSGHNTPGFADLDAQQTFQRWAAEIDTPEPPVLAAPVARWDFTEAAAPFASAVAGAPALMQGTGSTAKRVKTPFGGGAEFNGVGDYLRVARADAAVLNVGSTTGKVTVAAWVLSADTNSAMIAGRWQDSERSYALFNDLPTYGGDDRVCLHVSKNGGATPGYPHSVDFAADARKITRATWQLHVGTYDGAQAVAYLDGTAAPYPSYTDSQGVTTAKNPYAYPAGLNAAATDFLVGATVKNGVKSNQHKGVVARLRVWDDALSPAQVLELFETEKAELEAPPTVSIPTPVGSWDFAESAAPYASAGGAAQALLLGPGSTVKRVATPFGGGVEFNGKTDFLAVAEGDIGPLNVGATTNAVTVAAWVLSTDTNNANIAGIWQESWTTPARSYALFNDLPVYGGDDMVCMEVSKLGGATPGYPYSIDYAVEPRKMTRGIWQLHVGTYDGAQAVAYLDGTSTAFASYTDNKGATYAKNPYLYPDGLNATPGEFIVGAVRRDGALINLHKGSIAKLRVWNTALSAEQVKGLYDAERGALG